MYLRPLLLYFLLSLLASLSAIEIDASPLASLPAAYKGRFRPADTYARLWLYDLYHRQSLATHDLAAFDSTTKNALNLLWKHHFERSWKEAPLFWIKQSSLKKHFQLDTHQDRFSYHILKPILKPFETENRALRDETMTLLSHLQQFEGETFFLLPDVREPGLWRSLSALKDHEGNFTPYPQATFQKLRTLYLELEEAFSTHSTERFNALTLKLADTLHQAYHQLEGTDYIHAFGKALRYPTYTQLEAERLSYQLPLIEICICFYGMALCLALLSLFHPSKIVSRTLLGLISAAFVLHTFLLALRIYILQRPPVSNMFETILYVPWIATLSALIMRWLNKSEWILLASSATSVILLIVLKLSQVNSGLENVQAVLDSQYWLIVHVLMVVGSYGLFILSGILGHIYLIGLWGNRANLPTLANYVLKCMYLGLALLIPGTVLGGVWAAQSWGRFWDWDPKESWAFISACIYLLFVHAYRFGKIGPFGLAVGSVVGLQAISFTWYGVNYILGSGLHSYGFGSGGEIYYYIFLGLEGLFLTAVVTKFRLTRENSRL